MFIGNMYTMTRCFEINRCLFQGLGADTSLWLTLTLPDDQDHICIVLSGPGLQKA